jgi:hypothetical protein
MRFYLKATQAVVQSPISTLWWPATDFGGDGVTAIASHAINARPHEVIALVRDRRAAIGQGRLVRARARHMPEHLRAVAVIFGNQRIAIIEKAPMRQRVCPRHHPLQPSQRIIVQARRAPPAGAGLAKFRIRLS